MALAVEKWETLVGFVLILAVFVPGSSAAMDCGGGTCPGFASFIASEISGKGDGSHLQYCCKAAGGPYCCDWKDYAATFVGIDPTTLGLPVGAIVGIVIGGVVLMVLLCVCCCFCCGLCCFRGRRKRTVTTQQHHTVAFAPRGPGAGDPPPYNPTYLPPAKI